MRFTADSLRKFIPRLFSDWGNVMLTTCRISRLSNGWLISREMDDFD